MKLTIKQLKQIIKEQVEEAHHANPKHQTPENASEEKLPSKSVGPVSARIEELENIVEELKSRIDELEYQIKRIVENNDLVRGL